MKNSIKKILCGAALAIITVSANAATVFSDNFDSNNGGYNLTPTGWTVTNGTVDIIGEQTSYNFFPGAGNGKYIDLDGSTSDAGVLSKSIFLNAGTTYNVSFDLAGNQRNYPSDTVTVNFGTSTSTFTLNYSAGFSTYSLLFLPTLSGNYELSFGNNGNDEMGALLDNVKVVSAVPVPAAVWLFGSGIAGLIGASKHKKTIAAVTA